MKITNNSVILKNLFEIEEGDIFLHGGHYYIAGEINFIDHKRDCYDLSINMIRTFMQNLIVYSWCGDKCELIIR